MKNKFLDKYNKSPGNNDHGKYYYCNYAIIALKASKLVNLKKLVNEKSIYYLMPFERSIDIDEVSQLELIKQVIKKMKKILIGISSEINNNKFILKLKKLIKNKRITFKNY